LAPVVAYVRTKTSPQVWENFEYMAALAERYQDMHQTTYPRGSRRMPEDLSLVNLFEAPK
jgi:hypothetical protein